MDNITNKSIINDKNSNEIEKNNTSKLDHKNVLQEDSLEQLKNDNKILKLKINELINHNKLLIEIINNLLNSNLSIDFLRKELNYELNIDSRTGNEQLNKLYFKYKIYDESVKKIFDTILKNEIDDYLNSNEKTKLELYKFKSLNFILSARLIQCLQEKNIIR